MCITVCLRKENIILIIITWLRNCLCSSVNGLNWQFWKAWYMYMKTIKIRCKKVDCIYRYTWNTTYLQCKDNIFSIFEYVTAPIHASHSYFTGSPIITNNCHRIHTCTCKWCHNGLSSGYIHVHVNDVTMDCHQDTYMYM
jgi:hypothetical protein